MSDQGVIEGDAVGAVHADDYGLAGETLLAGVEVVEQVGGQLGGAVFGPGGSFDASRAGFGCFQLGGFDPVFGGQFGHFGVDLVVGLSEGMWRAS